MINDDERQVVQLLDDALPTPPGELDAAALYASIGAGRRARTQRLLSVAAVVVVVAVVGIAIALTRPAGSHGQPVAATDIPASTTPSPPVGDRRARTAAATERVLDVVPVVPDTKVVTGAARLGLTKPQQAVASGDFVSRGRVWAGHGTVASALHYLTMHLPAGSRLSGSGSTYGPNRPTVVEREYNLAARYQDAELYNTMQLQFAVTHRGSTVAIRADVTAVVRAARRPDQHVPLDVTGAVITRTMPPAQGPRPGSHRIDAADARIIARDINAAPVETSGVTSCPAALGGTRTVEVRFAGRPSPVVTLTSEGCVTVRSGRGPSLEYTPALERDLGSYLH